MTLQTEMFLKCFICSKLKSTCKIIKNQDGRDAICKEDFIKLVTKNYEDFIQIMTVEEAEKTWAKIKVDGIIPDCHNNP